MSKPETKQKVKKSINSNLTTIITKMRKAIKAYFLIDVKFLMTKLLFKFSSLNCVFLIEY